jgi:hypothetical protein
MDPQQRNEQVQQQPGDHQREQHVGSDDEHRGGVQDPVHDEHEQQRPERTRTPDEMAGEHVGGGIVDGDQPAPRFMGGEHGTRHRAAERRDRYRNSHAVRDLAPAIRQQLESLEHLDRRQHRKRRGHRNAQKHPDRRQRLGEMGRRSRWCDDAALPPAPQQRHRHAQRGQRE